MPVGCSRKKLLKGPATYANKQPARCYVRGARGPGGSYVATRRNPRTGKMVKYWKKPEPFGYEGYDYDYDYY